METTELSHQRKVEVCYSPALFPVYYEKSDCIVVIIDIFRATSAICTAFHYGVERVIPVATIDEALLYKQNGYVVAAERQGEIVEGFDMGNSPFSYMNPELKGKEIVLTTTNGTKAIDRAKAADQIVIGSFLNLNAVCNYLIEKNKNVILLCAGWKDRFNLEDSLFAGAVVSRLKQEEHYTGLADSSIAASLMYEHAKDDLENFLSNSSHRKRLARLNLQEDINYCLQKNTMSVVPVFNGNSLSL